MAALRRSDASGSRESVLIYQMCEGCRLLRAGQMEIPRNETNLLAGIVLVRHEEAGFRVGHYIRRKEFHIEKRQLDNCVLLLLTISGEGKLFYKTANIF